MALTDPAALTISGAAKNLARIATGELSSSYRLEDGANTYTLVVSHELPAKNKRNRIRVALRRDALSANPLVTGQNVPASLTVSVVADWDAAVHTAADPKVAYDALIAYLTGALFLRIAGGET